MGGREGCSEDLIFKQRHELQEGSNHAKERVRVV